MDNCTRFHMRLSPQDLFLLRNSVQNSANLYKVHTAFPVRNHKRHTVIKCVAGRELIVFKIIHCNSPAFRINDPVFPHARLRPLYKLFLH